MSKKLYKTTYSGKKIYVGDLDKRIYSRNVQGRHKYNYTNPKTGKISEGWCVDKTVCLDYILKDSNDSFIYVQIRDTENNIVYGVDRKTFALNAVPLLDRYFLPMEHWEVSKEESLYKHVNKIEIEEQ